MTNIELREIRRKEDIAGLRREKMASDSKNYIEKWSGSEGNNRCVSKRRVKEKYFKASTV
jgi:hypothetical protein